MLRASWTSFSPMIAAISVSLSAWVLPCVGHSQAQQPLAPAQPMPPAQFEFNEGVAALREGRFVEAAQHFERSHQYRAEPVALYNLAVSLRGAGQLVRAITTFERYALTPAQNAQGPMSVPQVRDEIARLRASVITVALQVQPPDVLVSIDGATPEPARTLYSLDPAPHALRVSAPGYITQTLEIVGTPGRAHEFTINLLRESQTSLDSVRVQPPASLPAISVSVHCSEPSAVVLLDGRQVSTGDVTLTVAPGPHTLVVQAPGFRRYQHSLLAQSGAIRVDANLVREGNNGWIIPVVVVGSAAAVAGIVTGVFFATRRGYLYEGSGPSWLGNTMESTSAQ